MKRIAFLAAALALCGCGTFGGLDWGGDALPDFETYSEEPRSYLEITLEHDYLVRLLRATEGNVTQAARMAQRNRTEFYKLLQRHNLTPALFKAEKEKA